MDDWTPAYIFVGIIIPLAYVASALYGILAHRRAATRAAILYKRQEGVYEAYWYAWKGTGMADRVLHELSGTKELVDSKDQQPGSQPQRLKAKMIQSEPLAQTEDNKHQDLPAIPSRTENQGTPMGRHHHSNGNPFSSRAPLTGHHERGKVQI